MKVRKLLTQSWLLDGKEVKALCKCAEKCGGEKGRRLNAAYKFAVAEIKSTFKNKSSKNSEDNNKDPSEAMKRAADATIAFAAILADEELLGVLLDTCQEKYVADALRKNGLMKAKLKSNLELLEGAKSWSFTPLIEYLRDGADAFDKAVQTIRNLVDMGEFRRLSVCAATSCGCHEMAATQKVIERCIKDAEKAIFAARSTSAEEKSTSLIKRRVRKLLDSSVALFKAFLVYFELTGDSSYLSCMSSHCKGPFVATEVRTFRRILLA